MRNIIVLLIMPIFLIGLGCNSNIKKKDAKHKLESLLDMTVSDSIEVTSYLDNSDLHGKYTEEFEVHFKNKEEFIAIFKKTKPLKFKSIGDVYCYQLVQNKETTQQYLSMMHTPSSTPICQNRNDSYFLNYNNMSLKYLLQIYRGSEQCIRKTIRN